jgi:2-keto-4-pentenoate hydratase/2-oxohepta-3-ene-1,7-dioic acid hydratase in catechol pathway
MRLARYSVAGEFHLGVIQNDGVLSITARFPELGHDMIALIGAWEEYKERIRAIGDKPDLSLADVRLEAPIARPGKIWGIGHNYADHIAETGRERPKEQVWFTKAGTAVAGPYDAVQRPHVSTALDYEAELVAVVGRRCKHLTPEQAGAAIFGYCVGNDLSVRDWQLRTPQVTIGKSFDTHAAFGPWIVTADEVDPKNMSIASYVNGERRQFSNTRELIFDCPAQLSHLSQAMTMEPGDILYTGTPGGIGAAMKPPHWLAPGDVVRVEIESIGFIENRVVQETVA